METQTGVRREIGSAPKRKPMVASSLQASRDAHFCSKALVPLRAIGINASASQGVSHAESLPTLKKYIAARETSTPALWTELSRSLKMMIANAIVTTG